MKTLQRMVLAGTGIASILFCIFQFGINLDSWTSGAHLSRAKPQGPAQEPVMGKLGEDTVAKQVSLEQMAKTLQNEVHELKLQIQKLQSQTLERDVSKEIGVSKGSCERYYSKQAELMELEQGVVFHNEYEMDSYISFTKTRMYILNPGLGKRVVEKPIGYKKKDIASAVAGGVLMLNAQRNSQKFNTEMFQEGIYRTLPSVGTHYELFFRMNTSIHTFFKVSLFRPFGPLHLSKIEKKDTTNIHINLIMPLSGRIATFESFLEKFSLVCITHDRHVSLTVVYFGKEGAEEARELIKAVQSKFEMAKINFILLKDENFSRGRGLDVGARAWRGAADVLLFLCDVDIVFSLEFLDRCRLNVKASEQVYFPIVFSLYNPQVTYQLQGKPMPREHERFIISKHTGWWRDIGYGMACLYRSDFLKYNGFDESITGWGMEDVHLFRKFVKSDLKVIRATDKGIFHVWHAKHCDASLPAEQYNACIASKALNEASHSQLGLLAFKEEVDLHRSLHNT